MNAATMIAKARIQLLLKNPFFSILALKLKPMEQERVETMATDGVTLIYNAEFVESLPPEHLKAVICHEVLHCALLHHTRRNGRNPKKWNIAADYAINWMLIKEFGMSLPDGTLIDEKYTNQTTEHIYNQLPDTPLDQCEWGMVKDAGSKSGAQEATIQEIEADWQQATIAAADAAKQAGDLPNSLTELLAKAKAKVNWKEQLARLIGGSSKTDYNWYPPDTQYIHRHLHIPTLNEPSIGHLALAIDTSGSVTNDELAQFIAELQSILDHINASKFTVIQCDADIQHIDELDPQDLIAPEVHGRGGTRVRPVFDKLNDDPPDCLIYYTDMGISDFPDEAPHYPVFWARTSDHSAPFGSYIDIFTRAEGEIPE